MKKFILLAAIIILGVLGYFGQDIYRTDQVKKELIETISENNQSFIQTNKTTLLKYPTRKIEGKTLQETYDAKFNDGSWNIVEIINHSKDYYLLFDAYPYILSDKVLLPTNNYLLEYFSNSLYGKELAAMNLVSYDAMSTIANDVLTSSPLDLYNRYYDLVMEVYISGEAQNETVYTFIENSEDFILQMGEKPEEVYAQAFKRLEQSFDSYEKFEITYSNLIELTTTIKNSDKGEELFKAFYKGVESLETVEAPTYTLEGLELNSGSNENLYVIPGKFLTFNFLQNFDPKRAKKEFGEYLIKEDKVSHMTLEENELYYIVTTNDFMKVSQIEIVYTFDEDYSQFVYGSDGYYVLKKRIEELGFNTGLEEQYTILFPYSIEDNTFDYYGRIIDEVLDHYTTILEPIMISNQVAHHFTIEDGHYYADYEDLFEPIYIISDISFFIVDEITSDYYYVDGLATTEGIIIPQSNMGRSKDARNTVHHELMHQIERFYSYRFNLDINLDHGNFVYLEDRNLSDKDYLTTIMNENFSPENVLDQVDKGMTSYYAGVNSQEHLAELWSDLVIDFDYYEPELGSNPMLGANAATLIDYINAILEIVDEEPLSGISDIKNFATDNDI